MVVQKVNLILNSNKDRIKFFNSNGIFIFFFKKMKGSGQVVFVRRGDAKRASDKYNNVTLDGRAMKIEIVLSSSAAAAAVSRSGRRGGPQR